MTERQTSSSPRSPVLLRNFWYPVMLGSELRRGQMLRHVLLNQPIIVCRANTGEAFILDDHAFHYMQVLQEPAFKRTTATILPSLDYCSLAKGFGVGYVDIASHDQLRPGIQSALAYAGPVLVRVQTDYSNRKIRWVEAVRAKFTKELTPAQKARFLARVGSRTITGAKRTSD